MKRSELKEMHESAVIKSFQKLCEAMGVTVDILSKPEPPDAIISINGEEAWVEITDAFITEDYAISITSAASEDRDWIRSKPQLINVDSFNEILAGVVQGKYNKASIKQVYVERGPGILMVGCFSPFHYPIRNNLDGIQKIIKNIYSSNEKLFKEIYLYDHDYIPVKVL